MDVSCATFTKKEIQNLLNEEGITEEKDTALYYQAFCQRFRPVEGRPNRYVEKENWHGEKSSLATKEKASHH